MLAKVDATTPVGKRDLAMLRLLHDCALRRFEVTQLDVAGVGRVREDGCCVVRVTGKGHGDDEPVVVPPKAAEALHAWLRARGDHAHPAVFVGIKDGVLQSRICDAMVWKRVKHYGRLAGVETWPHALRHGGITRAVEKTNGNVVDVAGFSRHKSNGKPNLNTVAIYVDNAKQNAAAVAKLVGGDD